MIRDFQSDPQWRTVSASQRKGSLFVKLPAEKAQLISASLKSWLANNEKHGLATRVREIAHFLQEEANQSQLSHQNSTFLALKVEVASSDVETLKSVQPSGRTLEEYCRALEAGLRNDAEADWILRVGGPRPTSVISPVLDEDPELLVEDLFPNRPIESIDL